MFNKLFLAVIMWLPVISLAGADSEQSGRSIAALPSQIDTLIDAAVEDGFAGGLTLLDGDTVVYSRVAGFADLRGRIPVSDHTLFNVASISKYLTASMVLKAAEDGVIDLDASIGDVAPELELARRNVSYRDLLAHQSGLGSSYVAEGISNAADALSAIDATEIDDSRAGAFRYSNDGYDVLGILLEFHYDRPFESILREHLLIETGLQPFSFWGEVDLMDPAVVSQPLKRMSRKLQKRNYGMIGSGGFLTTAAGLVAWQRALRSGKVLSKPFLGELLAPRSQISLGYATYGAFLIHHPQLGEVISALGYEDRGDNALLNDYVECGFTLAITTSRGPSEKSGKKPYRSSLSEGVEKLLISRCELD